MTKMRTILLIPFAFCFAVTIPTGCGSTPQESNSFGTNAQITEEPLNVFEGRSEIRDLETYRDREHYFTVMFPKDWKHAAVEYEDTRLSLVKRNADGSPHASVSISVTHEPGLAGISRDGQAAHLKRYVKDNIALLRSTANVPIQVLKTGEVNFGRHSGYYELIDIKMEGPVEVVRFLHIAAFLDGRTYGLTFSCEPENYESVLPVMKQIASTFTIESPPKGPSS